VSIDNCGKNILTSTVPHRRHDNWDYYVILFWRQPVTLVGVIVSIVVNSANWFVVSTVVNNGITLALRKKCILRNLVCLESMQR
jgi:hypothetical protein